MVTKQNMMKNSPRNYTRPIKKGDKSAKMIGSQKAAMFILLGVGVLMGYSANQMVEKVFGKTTLNINQIAVQAHQVYSKQDNHIVELNAIDQGQIEAWFSNSIKYGFKVPNLQKFGLEFVGARLTVAEATPAAYLLYIDDDDKQLAFFTTRSKSNNNGANQIKKLNLYTWHKDGFGYVLLGKVSQTNLQKMGDYLSKDK